MLTDATIVADSLVDLCPVAARGRRAAHADGHGAVRFLLSCRHFADDSRIRRASASDGPVKLFIIIYLAFALGLFTYSAFQFGQILVNADLQKYWERRRMDAG